MTILVKATDSKARLNYLVCFTNSNRHRTGISNITVKCVVARENQLHGELKKREKFLQNKSSSSLSFYYCYYYYLYYYY